LKEETLDRTLRRTRCGRGYGHVRQTTGWTKGRILRSMCDESENIPFDIFPKRCNFTQFIHFWKTALHVSGGIFTHHQEHI